MRSGPDERTDPSRDFCVYVLGCVPLQVDVRRALRLAAASLRGERIAHLARRPAHRDPTQTIRLVTFHDDPAVLLSLFDYHAHCILILLVEELADRTEQSALPGALEQLVSCWDGALILTTDDRHIAVLQRLAQSHLAPRLAVSTTAVYATLRQQLWALELSRLFASSLLHPRSSRHVTDLTLVQKLARLPATWQPIVHRAIGWSTGWTSTRLATECCASTRTLEREFRRVGLPSPARLLRQCS